MAKCAILVPYLDMCEMARPIVSEYPNLIPMCVEYTQTEQIKNTAMELERQGCELFIARGVQAGIIRENVRTPVVELHVTAQELGGILLELKRELNHPCPKLALIGFENMFGDMSQFNDLFGIELSCYFVNRSDELSITVEHALKDGCQAVVGGDIVCQKAHAIGVPCRFIPSGEESMRTALRNANSVAYAIDLEKHNSAEMNSMLDFTFSGIMQVDLHGTVCRVNRAGYNMLGYAPSEMVGKPLSRLVPSLTPKLLAQALEKGEEVYATVVDVRSKTMIVNLAPIQVDGQIEGAILTFQEGQRIIEMDSEMRRELYQRGFIAKYTFDTLYRNRKLEGDTERLARRMAKYNAPILINGESGTGKDIMAQCIHNESVVKNNAFVPVDCSAWMPENLDTMLFGNFTTRKDTEACLTEMAKDGTLYLSHVEHLPFETQYKVLNLIQHRFMHNGSKMPVAMNVRVLASSSVNLAARVERGEFRRDLYYALSVLSLELEPLRRDREHIMEWVERYMDEWQDHYKRYVHLTNGARKFMEEYDWPGNLKQINSTCERIVLLTEKRNIDETFVRHQLEQVTPNMLPGTDKVVLYKDQKAVKIAELLRKYSGSREQVAAELGVSKTTLWRYIKKYGIEPDYTY